MNKRFLNKAKELKPTLNVQTVTAAGDVGAVLGEGDCAVFDFGNHFVGYPSVELFSVGSHQDAPAIVSIKYCERREELDEDFSAYRGWISRGWLQEEQIRADVLPFTFKSKRRYAFRYIKIQVVAVSQKFRLRVGAVSAKVQSCVKKAVSAVGDTELERRIDEVSLRTLSECMQHEFEDGPKRDQRLWIGDLRLQALANYSTYGMNDLVKRCLYLFAGTADRAGRISACVFTKPTVEADDTYMFDYSLFFVCVLEDYLRETGDVQTAEELYPLAVRQIENARAFIGEDGVVADSDRLGWCFLDWSLELNKQAGAHAVLIYALRSLSRLASALGKDTSAAVNEAEQYCRLAKKAFFDEKKGVFVSGAHRQVSYASNVWMCLAGVLDASQNRQVLDRLKGYDGAVKPVTPYMYHHYIQALIDCGELQTAREVMNDYWGGMVELGADTFFELYNPENPDESPYGSKAVNSYCHAWSCTPSYLLRKYFVKK